MRTVYLAPKALMPDSDEVMRTIPHEATGGVFERAETDAALPDASTSLSAATTVLLQPVCPGEGGRACGLLSASQV